MKKYLSIAAALAMASVAAPAFAQVAVIDQAVISNTANAVSAINNQTNETRKITSINEDIADTIGQYGSLDDLRQLPQWQEFKDGGAMAEAMATFGPNTCALVACGTGGQEAELDDLSATREWVSKNFFVKDAPSLSEQNNLSKLRNKAMVQSSMAGYSMSMMARQDLSRAQKKSQDLEDLVSGSDTLRADVRANSAVALAQYQVQVQQLAMLSSLVEIQASQQLAASGDYVDAGGGEAPPEVYQAGDYDPVTGRRISTSVDDEGVATGQKAGNAPSGSGNRQEGSSVPSGNAGGSNNQGAAATQGTLFTGTNPLVPRDPSYANTAQQLIQTGADVLRQNGNTGAANVLSGIGSSLSGVSSNPYGVVWSSAGATAYSSSPDLYNVIQTAEQAARTGNQSQMNNLLSVAQSVAQTSGDSNALAIMAQTNQSWQQNGSADAQNVALNAAYVISQYGGYPQAEATSNILLLDPSQASSEQLYQLGTQTAESFSQSAHTGLN